MGNEAALPYGAFDALVTEAVAAQVAGVDGGAVTVPLDPAESARRIAEHLRGPIAQVLTSIPAKDRPRAQVELANGLLGWLASMGPSVPQDHLVDPARILRALHRPLLSGQEPPRLPDVPLSQHDLLANAPGEPALSHALATELATADRVDAVVAFIRWTGLNLLRPAIEDARRRGVPVRVLTTTFTGSTQRPALDWLVEQGVEVKVSYDTRITRLHAKAWLVHRDTGFSTAYVGSSNLSRAALVDGIEWNVRLAEAAAEPVVDKLRATFDSLWNDPSFEAYDPAVDADRLDHALQRTSAGTAATAVSGLEVRPWHYQREILEALVVDRARFGRTRNLVVAPTGTGKTVVAALDYRGLREGRGGVDLPRDPTLLFVAHRETLLDQSLGAFRAVMARGDFGEKLVGGQRPKEWRHVFASIQSLHAMGVDQLPADQFDVVYVDEFHHAEASTYRALLDHLTPKVTVGLTATPERADGVNVRDLFGGRYSFEMRLWDALDQQLLAPFHYFGIADGTDLSGLAWQRGGYRIGDLEAVYVVDGHDARTAKVLRSLGEVVGDVGGMRAFGFCVSVAHAEYMARKFRDAGIPAVSMSGETPQAMRQQQLDALRDGEINVVFAVDVLTEGVDVPSVDTILLLRPTESATVFLQQLGRGLRLHPEKSVCTVLDFIGQQHRRFRSDLRLRALTGRSRGQLMDDVEEGFPFLPAGCHLRLDRQAEAVILDNLKAVVSTSVRSLVAELRMLQDQHGPLRLAAFLELAAIELGDVYKSAGWAELQRRAGGEVPAAGERDGELRKGLTRLLEVDDPERLAVLRTLAAGEVPAGDARTRRLASMVGFVLFDDGRAPGTVEEVVEVLAAEPAIRWELAQLVEVLEAQADHLTRPSGLDVDVPLHLHATYRREEVLVALGDRALGDKTSHREGVKYVRDRNTDVCFVTLEKSDAAYSPTTRYRDYAISPELFHWESQSVTSRASATGQRYLDGSSTVLLFVRRTNKVDGRAPAYVFLGRCTHVEDRGERPIQITWRLEQPMPERWFRAARAVAG